jgi:Dolichyl-phosphate-mannose-protein mannosyltransferase
MPGGPAGNTNAVQPARSRRRLSPWVAVGALIVLSTAVRAWAALDVPVPWIAPDEMTYGLLGRSLYDSGTLDILGGPTPYFSLFFPAFVGLPLSLGDLAQGYDVLKVVQALAMSLTAIPVFLWGRSLVGPRWALVVAALTLALPGLVYSGLVMTEVLFYPLLVLAAWATARAIQEPSTSRQLLLVAAVAVAVLTRLQALALVPAVLAAYGVDAALQRSGSTLRRSRLVLGLGAVALVVLVAASSAGLGAVLGGYGVVTHGSYDAGSVARYVVYHAASVTILTGIFPVCALLLLLVSAARRREPDAAVRALVAVAISFTLLLVFEVGAFASRYVGQLAERDLIGLAPILFLVLAVWIERGDPHGRLQRALVVLAVAVPLAVLPLGRMVTSFAPPDAPTLAALWDLRRATSLTTLEIVLFAAVAAALVLFALVPRRLLWVLALLVLAMLAGASVAASREATDQARDRQATYLGPDPRWIDHAAGGPVAVLFTRGSGWVGVWESLFWNRRIESVYGLDGAGVFGPVKTRQATVRRDGAIVTRDGTPFGAEYVVAPFGEVEGVPAYDFAGTMVATITRPASPVGGLALWRVDRPLRLASRSRGLLPNGDVYARGDGHLVAFACHPGGHFLVTLLIKEPQTVTILRNDKVYRRLQFRSPSPNQPWRAEIPTVPRPGIPPGRGTCSLDVKPSGLIGTTLFRVEG